MPSDNYQEREEWFDKVCESGITPYVHPSGFVGYRVVPGVPESDLQPYYSSPSGQRAKNSGDYAVFLADTPETASAECFGNTEFEGSPPDTWLLRYKYSGRLLNISLIPHDEFKQEFVQWSGDVKHEFSQDFKYYLKDKGLITDCDSIGWESVAGKTIDAPGFVYAWHSGDATEFAFLDQLRVDPQV